MSDTEKTTMENLDLDAIMRQDSGRRFLTKVLEKSGYFKSSYSEDARSHAFAEGMKELGYWLVEEMQEVNPAQLINILEDHHNAK